MTAKRPEQNRIDQRVWEHRGQRRPAFASEPGPGQESVWDYPRPPRVVPDGRLVEVRAGGRLVAHSRRSVRVLETASPPTFYIPRADVRMDLLQPSHAHSFCEWKGQASYYDVRGGDGLIGQAAWSYERPFEPFTEIAGHISFYPGRVDCYVEGERVRPQAGRFYGGWLTDEIVGPFKGEAGTGDW